MSTIIFEFLSGVGVFLFAIHSIDNCVETGTKLPTKINKYIKIPIISWLLGIFSATLTQSSSAINSIISGLRDKELIEEKTSFFAVAGSNIGTTITAYFAVMQNVSLASFCSSLIFFATLILLLIKNKSLIKISTIIVGFSLIFISFGLISKSIPNIVQLLDLSFLTNINPFIPFIVSLVITAICQSSSLITVIIVTFSKLNILPLTNALFMIMATNIGTCSTVFLSAIGKSKKGLKVAIFNLAFNLIGFLVIITLYNFNVLKHFYSINVSDDTKIAIFHTLFNIISCMTICPFLSIYYKRKYKNSAEKISAISS